MSNHPVTRKDSVDFRDRIYQPALIPLRRESLPKREFINIRNQSREGSCTGFGLAAVIDYLGTERTHREGGTFPAASARMLYEMAKLHDRWPGEAYEGSSVRGAMKGWHKNGVCPEKDWKYTVNNPGHLTRQRRIAARQCPLGAYYRVMPRRSDLHAAVNEVPAIYASAQTHSGWNAPDAAGVIRYDPKDPSLEEQGGHAFAIIGYVEDGFIIQNSWGDGWGGLALDGGRQGGLAIWTYQDFEDNLWDAWVARMALPVESLSELVSGRFVALPGGTRRVEKGPPREDIAGHYIHIDDGQFDPKGDYPSSLGEVKETIAAAFNGESDHVLLYAHGGLNRVKGAASRAGKWRPVFRDNRVHEIHFFWETGAIAELRDILLGKEVFADERAGGVTDWTDRWLERLSQPVGHALWREMQSDAEIAFLERHPDPDARRTPAGTETLLMILKAHEDLPGASRPKIHLVGHSAGSILYSHLLSRWAALNGPAVENLILFAPACTVKLAKDHIAPALLRDGGVGALHHFLLTDDAEQDDNVAKVYRKSLLYLVSRAYQRRTGNPVPLMGMARYEDQLKAVVAGLPYSEYRSPDLHTKTASSSHGGFDNDLATMNTMLSLVLDGEPARPFTPEDLKGY